MCLVSGRKLYRNRKVHYLWVESQYRIKKIKLNLKINWNHSRVWHRKWSNNMIKNGDNKNVFKNKLFSNLRHRRLLKIYWIFQQILNTRLRKCKDNGDTSSSNQKISMKSLRSLKNLLKQSHAKLLINLVLNRKSDIISHNNLQILELNTK